ncbi:MAG: EAL domain-containing protein [Lachnospiraceae bacterium]|nr:EAL domain-containing protein [Lachnospiraceae bacterium]
MFNYFNRIKYYALFLYFILFGIVVWFVREDSIVLVAIPFLILSISLYSARYTVMACAGTVALAGLNLLNAYISDIPISNLYTRLGALLYLLSAMVFIVAASYVIESNKNRRVGEVLEERRKLINLISVTNGRIFEYDVNEDRFMTARASKEGYENVRYIDDFHESAKQYRYVLFADFSVLDRFVEDCRNGVEDIEYDMRLRDRNADYIWYRVKGSSILDDNGKPTKVIGYLENINDRKKLELRTADENKRDSLTKLYKYDYVRELINDYLSEQKENNSNETAALITMDVDNFGILNDKMGKTFGDEVLKNIASDLDRIFYSSDILGRVGRDEYVILMKHIGGLDDIVKKIHEVRKVISKTYVGEEISFGSSVGIGASIYPVDGESFDVLFDKAEKAMAYAKLKGVNSYSFYNENKEDKYGAIDMKAYRLNHLITGDEGTSDSLIELAFKLMDESKDTDSAINLLIRQVAKRLDLSGIGIRVRIGKELKTRMIYGCCFEEDKDMNEDGVELNLTQWAMMLENFRNNNNMLVINDVADSEITVLRQSLLADGVMSYVGCAFYDKGDFAGDVSFVDYNKVREWSNEELTVIRAVTNVVSSYLLKMKAYEDASNTVERLTGYDSVTGLLMYEKFLSLTAEYIENAPHGRYAFIYMDFSNFKYVNETYGYETGDSILKNLADELQLQSAFYIYGSRVFSDNIVVFAKIGDMSDEELVKYIEQLGKNFSDRVQMQYIDSKLYLDVGVSTFSICGQPVPLKNIISNANVARKRTKLPDSPRVIIYSEEMGEELRSEIAYASDMENAFRNHEFVVYMQPKVNLRTNQIDGAEALIRWKKMDGRIIFPNDFIPVFEKNKSITLLDFYVYDEVCKYIRQRMDMGKKVVRISVNVSRVHLMSIDELVNYIKSLLTKYKIPPQYLEFELTETVFSDKMDDTIILMKKLREELGVMVSMDDFGSGYSSLNVLTKLPLDVLKLDKDFLKDFENDPDEKIIIPSVIDMAKKLNLSVVCEGVETKEQVAFLQDVGCDYAQGYFYSKPIPVEQFNELLEVI